MLNWKTEHDQAGNKSFKTRVTYSNGMIYVFLLKKNPIEDFGWVLTIARGMTGVPSWKEDHYGFDTIQEAKDAVEDIIS